MGKHVFSSTLFIHIVRQKITNHLNLLNINNILQHLSQKQKFHFQSIEIRKCRNIVGLHGRKIGTASTSCSMKQFFWNG